MTEVFIRESTMEDIDDVFQMHVDWADEALTYGQVPQRREVLVENIGPYFYVAVDGDNTVGFAYGSTKVSNDLAILAEGERYFEIDELYVKPDHRGSGIGGELLDRLVEACKGRGIHRFKVYSASKDLDGAMRFYRRHGFKSWYVEMFI